MRRVIVTVGPQFAGKSAFCRRVKDLVPKAVLISRDTILAQLHGSRNAWNIIEHERAQKEMWNAVKESLIPQDVTLILDTWNESTEDRARMIAELMKCGAECIEAWYFTTPLDQCLRWRLKREKRGDRLSEEDAVTQYRHAFRAFHQNSRQIRSEGGFASVRNINPVTDYPGTMFSIHPEEISSSLLGRFNPIRLQGILSSLLLRL